MSGVRLEVQWSPVHPDKFITWGTEINLYEVKSLKEAAQPSIKISDTTAASLVASNSNHPYVKCVDIYPHNEADVLLAIGQINGKVILSTFGPSVFDCLGLSGKELVPRHVRQCYTVAWNPAEPNLIAAGLEKHRTEHSVLLWDLHRCPHSNGHTSHHTTSTAMEPVRPSAELGLLETAHSLAWLRGQPRCLMVGLNNKQIKLYDFRDPGRAVNSTPTKAVYGLAVDPHADTRLASFVDSQIYIWDTRNFEKPVLFLSQNKPVSKISWCPTRNNLLGTLQRDSTSIGLYDIQPTMVGNDEVEPSFLERAVLPGVTGVAGGVQSSSAGAITSFSWHPTHENRLLNISLSGNLTDYTVFERITLNWSPSSHIVWTHGWRTLKTVCDKDPIYSNIDSEAILFKKRALSGYGLRPNLADNGELAENKELKRLWRWLHLSSNLVEEGLVPSTNTRHPGVRSVLKKPDGNPALGDSSIGHGSWSDANSSQITARLYKSDEREQALQLCGWSLDRDSFLDQLESDGHYSRAAAIAVFNLRLRQAVDILRRGAEHPRTTFPANLNIVAVALSGFSDDKSSMWRQQCISAKSYLSDPYLRVMFAFLTSESDTYEDVLEEKDVSVEDRVAFACCFLSDTKLSDYLRNLTARLSEEGDLGGILLTGATIESIALLQRFLDKTGDIQSISFIAARAFPPLLLKEDTVQEWISNYRNLLDSWRLWTQRAHFDIALSAKNEMEKPPQQVFVSCNFCGKSISAFMQGRGRGLFARVPNKSKVCKITSCPNCRKPLPRCSICLLNMGSAAGAFSVKAGSTINRTIDSSSNPDKLAEFSSWFTWCQSCRHGGHASHIMNWFSEHLECPVTACTCRCMSLDFAAKVISVPVV